MSSLLAALDAHPFTTGLDAAHISRIAACASEVHFAAGEAVAKEGRAAAPVSGLVAELITATEVHCLRDPTRGGLAAVLDELSQGFDILVQEGEVPVHARVRAPCELLGLDPLQLACEGRVVAFVPQAGVVDALAVLRDHDPSAAIVGRVEEGPGRVWLTDAFGGQRLLVRPWGDPLPRIC